MLDIRGTRIYNEVFSFFSIFKIFLRVIFVTHVFVSKSLYIAKQCGDSTYLV